MATAARPRHRKPRRAAGFILLEVLVALVILSVTMAALLRGFMVAMSSIKANRVQANATLLMQSLLEDYEIEPPAEGRAEGTFAEDPRFGEEFEHFSWYRDVDEVRVRYRDVPRRTLQEPEPLYLMYLEIRHDDGRGRESVPMRTVTYLMESQLFTDQSIAVNQLF